LNVWQGHWRLFGCILLIFFAFFNFAFCRLWALCSRRYKICPLRSFERLTSLFQQGNNLFQNTFTLVTKERMQLKPSTNIAFNRQQSGQISSPSPLGFPHLPHLGGGAPWNGCSLMTFMPCILIPCQKFTIFYFTTLFFFGPPGPPPHPTPHLAPPRETGEGFTR
jgi:hypothetical protein